MICISYLSEEQNTFARLQFFRSENVCLNIEAAIAFLSVFLLKHFSDNQHSHFFKGADILHCNAHVQMDLLGCVEITYVFQMKSLDYL